MSATMTQSQVTTVLNDIAIVAREIDQMSRMIVDECGVMCAGPKRDMAWDEMQHVTNRLEAMAMSIQYMAQRVGWCADLAVPGAGVHGDATQWMLPPTYHDAAKKEEPQWK